MEVKELMVRQIKAEAEAEVGITEQVMVVVVAQAL
jgi:hypothetical protein